MSASTYGVGQLIEEAAARGARSIGVALGGSCTTDGGAGVLEALGARLIDDRGQRIPRGGAALARLARLDLGDLRAPASLVAATDVDNPLLGPTGAVATYAEQKGADAEARRRLEHALERWADVVEATTGRSARDLPGVGAAGGAAFGLVAVLGATIAGGADVVLDLLDLERHLDAETLVIVGEGSLDRQTLHGKAPVAVARRAAVAGSRVVAVAGRNDLGPAELEGAGIERVWTLSELEPDLARSMAGADGLLEQIGRRIAQSVCGAV
ncbi:MAG: glycerate kinase [Nocardioides sp.]